MREVDQRTSMTRQLVTFEDYPVASELRSMARQPLQSSPPSTVWPSASSGSSVNTTNSPFRTHQPHVTHAPLPKGFLHPVNPKSVLPTCIPRDSVLTAFHQALQRPSLFLRLLSWQSRTEIMEARCETGLRHGIRVGQAELSSFVHSTDVKQTKKWQKCSLTGQQAPESRDCGHQNSIKIFQLRRRKRKP